MPPRARNTETAEAEGITVKYLLQEEPKALFVHCVAHCGAYKSGKKSKVIRDALSLVNEIALSICRKIWSVKNLLHYLH